MWDISENEIEEEKVEGNFEVQGSVFSSGVFLQTGVTQQRGNYI